MEIKTFKYPSYNIHTIKSTKYKNCIIEIILRNNLDINKITNLSVLTKYLCVTNNKYKTKRDFNIHLQDLYNSGLYVGNNRVGSVLHTTFTLDFLNPKYMNENILNDIVSFPFDCLFKPNINNTEFDTDILTNIKNKVSSSILRLKENPTSYAFHQFFNKIYPSSPVSMNLNGNLKDLELINNESLYKTYTDLLNNSYFDVFVIGDLEMDKVVKIINSNIQLNTIKEYALQYEHELEIPKKEQVIKEKGCFDQAKLIVGLNIESLTPDEKNMTLNLYNMILGGSSLDNKLGIHLRKENSLCYHTQSTFNKFDRFLTIYAGIDENNYELAIKLIKQSLKEINKGSITEEELNSAKKTINNALKLSQDSNDSILSYHIFKILRNNVSIEELTLLLNKITKNDIIKLSKKIKINSIYLLSKGGEKND